MNRLSSIALALAVFAPEVVYAQLPEGVPEVVVGDEESSLRIAGIAQLQLAASAPAGGDVEVTPRLRRVRPILHGRLLGGDFQARLHLEANPEAPELIDLWVDLAVMDGLRLRAGQLKVPFTDYWQRSLTEMAVDWPLSNRWFGGERQLGAMAYGQTQEGLQYAVGVFSGQNRRSSFARELPRLYGGSAPNPSSFIDGSAPDEMHAELVGRIAHHSEGVRATETIDRAGGGLRHAVALSFAWDSAPVRGRDFTFRVAPEATFKLEGFALTVVAYLGLAPTLTETYAPGAAGGLVELSYRVDTHLDLTARYARVAVFDALREDAGSPLTGQHELTLAAQAPILGRDLIVQLDLGWMRSERADEQARDSARARLQLQAAF